MPVDSDQDVLPRLQPYEKRQFLPNDFSFESWEDLEPYYEQLFDRLNEAEAVEELEGILHDFSELESVVDEESSRRYVRMTCETDNEAFEQAYLDFIENIQPKLKQARQSFREHLAANTAFEQLPDDYDVYRRSVKNSLELFEEDNVPLETEVSKLSQQYQKLSGELTVEFEGEEQTLQQMKKHLEDLDRDRRKNAWEAIWETRYEHRNRFEELFDQLHELRVEIAENAGFEQYRDYVFRQYERFDYSPEDCFDFHEAVRDHLLPLKKKLQEIRKQRLGLDRLRPWDTSVNLFGKPPLEAYEEPAELIEKVGVLLRNVDPAIEQRLRELDGAGTLDLLNRKGKAPGGYQTVFGEARLPFIFMNGVGLHRDVKTLLHETGHALHTFQARDHQLKSYRGTGMEFAEVASMSMELFGGEYFDQIYAAEDAERVRLEQIESLVGLFPWVARIDRFQQKLYEEPPSAENRRETWESINEEYDDLVDWSGYEQFRARSWHPQLHVFQYPFYYIEYGIAQLGAIQFWQQYLENPEQSLNNYRDALELGGSRPLPELFKRAGLTFDFSSDTVKPAAEFLDSRLDDYLE